MRAASSALFDTLTPRATRSVQRILEAAAGLFGREGYQGASMLSVAREAGVSKGLLHYHFRSKEHLLVEAQRAIFRQLWQRWDHRFDQGEQGMAAALEALDALWASIREMRTWAPFMVEVLSLAAEPGPVRRHLDEFYAEADDMLEQGIRRAFVGQLDALMLPPARLGPLVRVGMHGLIYELALVRSERDLSRIDQSYRDIRAAFEQAVLSGPLPTPSSTQERS